MSDPADRPESPHAYAAPPTDAVPVLGAPAIPADAARSVSLGALLLVSGVFFDQLGVWGLAFGATMLAIQQSADPATAQAALQTFMTRYAWVLSITSAVHIAALVVGASVLANRPIEGASAREEQRRRGARLAASVWGVLAVVHEMLGGADAGTRSTRAIEILLQFVGAVAIVCVGWHAAALTSRTDRPDRAGTLRTASTALGVCFAAIGFLQFMTFVGHSLGPVATPFLFVQIVAIVAMMVRLVQLRGSLAR